MLWRPVNGHSGRVVSVTFLPLMADFSLIFFWPFAYALQTLVILIPVGWFISFFPWLSVDWFSRRRSRASSAKAGGVIISPVKPQSSAAVTLAHRAKWTDQTKNLWWLSNIWKEVYLENEILIFSSLLLSWFFTLVLFFRQALIQPLHQSLSQKPFFKSISKLVLLGFK